MHRYDYFGLQLLGHPAGHGGIDGEKATHRQEDHIHGTCLCHLLGGQFVAEVAEVANLYPIDLKAGYGIAAPILSAGSIMEGGNALEFDTFYFGIVFGHLGIALYGGNIAVVGMVMAYGSDVGGLIYLAIVKSVVRLIRVGDDSHTAL